MRFRDLLYVTTIYEENSFTRAAEKLYVSQSALSQRIRHLEAELNIVLFIRKNNKIEPTSACHTFVEDGKAIIQAAETLRAKMKSIALSKAYSLKIGVSSFYNKYLLSQIIPCVEEALPEVTIDITEEPSNTIEQLVSNGLLDICLVPIPLQTKNLEYETVYKEEIMVAIPSSHPLNDIQISPNVGGFSSIELGQLKDCPFIMLDQPRFWARGLELCDEAGFAPFIAHKTKVWDNVREFAEKAMGVGFVSSFIANNDRANTNLRYYRIHSSLRYRPYVAAYRDKQALTRTGMDFIGKLRDVLEEHC